MNRKLLHIYRNSPLGRETLLQSIWFARKTGCRLEVYIPRHAQLLLYLESSVATIGLDSSYLRDPETAEERVRAIAAEAGLPVELIEPSGYTADNLPNLVADHAYMTCPRSMSELSSRVHLGHIGPRVRSIVLGAPFPVLLPTSVFKPWESVVACYGGSQNSLRALILARRLARHASFPLRVFTWADGHARSEYEKALEEADQRRIVAEDASEWLFVETPSLEQALYEIPREALIVAGAYGHGPLREALFGSKPEKIQSEVPNNLLLVGPRVPPIRPAAPAAPPGD